MRLCVVMFDFGLRGGALVPISNRLKERLLRIQFPKEEELVSRGCYNKVTHRWPKTMEMYSLTVLEATSMKSSCWQDHVLEHPGENLSLLLPPSSDSGCSLTCSSITPVSTLDFTWPSLPTLPACVFFISVS